jgi:PAS domain S-box-containing protein
VTTQKELHAEIDALRRQVAALEAQFAASEQERSRLLSIDTTERKQAEEILREREEKLKNLLDILPVGVSILDGDRQVVFSNPAVRQILHISEEGLSRGDYRQRNYLAADGTPMPPEGFASVQAQKSGQAVYHVETGVVKEDGQIIWTSISAVPLNFPDWKTVIITADITERKQAEEKLRESEEFLHLAYDAADLGIWKNDLRTGSVEFDERARIHYGFDTLQTTISEVMARVHPDDLARLGAEIAAATAPTGSGKFATEYRVTHPDGSIHWLAIGVRVTFEGEGEQRYAVMGYGTSLDITERKQVEETLRQSEQKYSALFEKLAVPAALTKMPAGVFADVNEAFQSSYGYSREELIGKTSVEIGMARPDERAQSYLDLEQYGALRHNEKHLFTKAGEVRIGAVNINKALINGQDYVITTIHDVTDRKRAEETLRQRTEELEQLLEMLPQAIWIASDPGCKVIRGNRFANELLGVSGQENISQSAEKPAVKLRQFSQGRELSPDELPMQMAARTGKPQLDFELRIERPDNITRTLLGGAVPLFDPQGKTRGVISIFHDITDRKRAEEELRASEKLLKDVIDNTAALVYILDLEGRFLLANNKVEALFGLSNEQIVGQKRQAFMPAEFAEQHRNNDIEIIQAGQGKLIEEENLEPDGRHIYLTNKFPLFDAQDRVYAICGISTDMTAQKQMEEDLRRSNAELEQFAYVASHDLQEPLRAVAGMVQLLQRKYQGQLDERADQYITHAVEAAGRMQALITDLLSYSRVDRYGKPFEKVKTAECLRVALKNLEISIRESEAAITWDDLPTVMADGPQLAQLFQNLIGNAIKFRGEAQPQIHISARQKGDAWEFSVRDNGIGIEPQYFERIFLVFQRLHTRREYAGTGIGLALCKKIVERHGGQIWVESQLGQGATFYFTLPTRSTHHDH